MSVLRTRAVVLAVAIILLPTIARPEEPAPLAEFRNQAQSAGSADVGAAPTFPIADSIRKEVPAPSVTLSKPANAMRALRDAVSANDLARFGSTLSAARSLADRMPIGPERNSLRRALLIYGDLETVWQFASSDRAGSFYDDEALPGFHDHLSADYPAYQRFIEGLRVIDGTGRTLYPTAETRAFLLRQLVAIPPPARPLAATIRLKRAPAKPLPPATPAHAHGRPHARVWAPKHISATGAHPKVRVHAASTKHAPAKAHRPSPP